MKTPPIMGGPLAASFRRPQLCSHWWENIAIDAASIKPPFGDTLGKIDRRVHVHITFHLDAFLTPPLVAEKTLIIREGGA
mmetsp:Transcript_11636/g.11703  ORF Transcript_11636/g.11703 Transcript_11636/m.11703 type:complete len:80 (+) Transcript_11636:143-382(+)